MSKPPGDEALVVARRHLSVLRRRKGSVLLATLLVAGAALLFSLVQTRLYAATAQVFLSRQNLAASLTGTPDPTVYQQADRVAQTQVDLARVPTVARRTLQSVKTTALDVPGFLGASSVSARQDADILVFTVRNADRTLAVQLATAYATEFTAFRREIDTAALQRARTQVEQRLTELRSQGKAGSRLYSDLVDKSQELSTMEALQASNSFVVGPAERAAQVQPATKRNVVLGLLLGVLLGAALAFLRESLDTRVRTDQDVSEILDIPLLARLPAPALGGSMVPTITEPGGFAAESFRMLRANLEFLRLERDVRSIMITSAVEQEGKSTTAVNLAVSMAQAGQPVALVDLDLRRPSVSRLLGLGSRPGVSEVTLGKLDLEQALVPVVVGRKQSPNGNGHGDATLLHVLVSGPTPPDPGEFVARPALRQLLHDLRERFNLVLIDAPPMLHIGDAMTLSADVDGLLLVTRANVVHGPMISELKRLLDSTPAERLGFVLTGGQLDAEHGYYSSYSSGHVAPARKPAASGWSGAPILKGVIPSLRRGDNR
jgi:tyrosine-protein kinase